MVTKDLLSLWGTYGSYFTVKRILDSQEHLDNTYFSSAPVLTTKIDFYRPLMIFS